MENGASRSDLPATAAPRPVALDAREAVLLAERALVQVLDAGGDDADAPEPAHNAFGEAVRVEPLLDPVARVRRAAALASSGERVALFASAAELAPARSVMHEMAAQRLGVVFHAIEAHGAEAALALADLGWGLLFASDVEESQDLTLVARRAAEDSGTPFLVVHDHPSVRRVEPLAPLDGGFVAAFVGPAGTRMRAVSDPAHPGHAQVGPRAFAERVPFALASALRDLESLTGRRRDLLTRSAPGQGGEASLMLVGLGALGDVLLGEVPRLRALGHDVGAVKLTAFRPFPGPRAVRLLARALAITVLEHTDEPLAQSNPVTREIKAAFSDAITWAPEYPGVGRVPRVHSGITGAPTHDVESRDVDAVVHNMLAGETGKRFFVLGGEPAYALDRAPVAAASIVGGPPVFHMRGVVKETALAVASAELASEVLARVLGLRVRSAVGRLAPHAGGGHAFDLSACSQRPLGAHLSPSMSLVVLDDASALIHGNPVARLGRAGTLAVPSRKPSAEGLWADIPPYVKAIIHDRQGRVAGWELPPDASPYVVAGAFVGLALGELARSEAWHAHVDPSLVDRAVAEAVEVMEPGPSTAPAAGAAARRAFEAALFVPRGVVEQDQEAVRLGRMDARATPAA